jgi:hypothetical protein
MNLKILNEVDRILHQNPSLTQNTELLLQVINGVFNIEMTSIKSNDIYELCKQIDEYVLNVYFSQIWQAETKKYKYSGLSIIDEVNAMNPEAVIDIGCGYNEFRGKINNLIGIDPYNKRADVKDTILTYKTDVKYDVAIALGSINFGSSDKIIAEMTAAVNLVKPGGKLYFRVNPGVQHTALESRWINFYDWSPVFISSIAQTLNCDVEMIRQDTGDRFYFVLAKHSN